MSKNGPLALSFHALVVVFMLSLMLEVVIQATVHG